MKEEEYDDCITIHIVVISLAIATVGRGTFQTHK
jgi:hypothetical protein